MNSRNLISQFLVIFLATFAAILVFLWSGMISYVAYAVEKGRLEALRQELPESVALVDSSAHARQVAELVLPAVVYIETEPPPGEEEDQLSQVDPQDEDWLYKHLDELFRRHRRGLGSGVIIDAGHGLILTNYHVIEGAGAIRVHLADQRELTAKVIGQDPPTDLAVIGIDADRLHAGAFGSSDELEIGDPVYALGSPFGLAGTMSQGIISAKGRWHPGLPMRRINYQGFLQTDAAINPGNSGGPLVNQRGEIVGITTSIATDSGGYQGVGFAIPSSRITPLLPKLTTGQPIVRSFLGVEPLSVFELPDRAAALGWTRHHGVIVNYVLPDTAAAAAGLQADDILMALNGVPIESAEGLIDAIGALGPDTRVTFEIWRGGQQITAEVTLGERPGDTPS